MNQENHPFDENYFKSGPYEKVSMKTFSQYWWSNRFYALLGRRHGPKSGKVLEVGCGMGHLLSWMTDRYKVYGVDINVWAINQAQRNVPQGHFAVMSAEDLDRFEDAAFQIVIAKHVVEHLPDPERAVAEFARVLAPDGLLVLATPNLDSPMRWWKKENWIGYQDKTHINLQRPPFWLEQIKRNGLRPKRVFSDGFWDAPYLPLLPVALQKLLFGWPGGLQAVLGQNFIPLSMGESLIVLAEKPARMEDKPEA